MVTGEDGRHGVRVTVHVTLKLELDNVTTRPPPVEEHLVLDPQPILTYARVVSNCETIFSGGDGVGMLGGGSNVQIRKVITPIFVTRYCLVREYGTVRSKVIFD